MFMRFYDICKKKRRKKKVIYTVKVFYVFYNRFSTLFSVFVAGVLSFHKWGTKSASSKMSIYIYIYIYPPFAVPGSSIT